MSGKLAFVIEDDFDGSMVFAKALEANGLEPEQIMSGHLALERLGNSVPTLVVLDLHLPVVPGPDILKAIRVDRRLTDTLVVVVTADPRMAELIRDDADLVLLKPTTFSQVRDLVGRLMAVRERTMKAAAATAEAPAAETPAAAPAPSPAAAPEPAAAAPAEARPVAETKPEPKPAAADAPAAEAAPDGKTQPEAKPAAPAEAVTAAAAAPDAPPPANPPAAKSPGSSKSKTQIKPA